MRWLNIEIANLRSPAFVGAEPVERATWLSLLAYCADQENGGVITDCRSWKDRQWQQTCGITQAEAQAESGLWKWQDDQLVVEFYPLAKEAEIQAKRSSGSMGGKASGEARREAQLQGVLEPQLEAHLERKGKERKVMEGKGKEVGRVTAPQRSNSYLLDDEFWAEMKRHYPGIDIDAESRKQDAWLLAHPGRKKTRQFVINWLNKVEIPLFPAKQEGSQWTWEKPVMRVSL